MIYVNGNFTGSGDGFTGLANSFFLENESNSQLLARMKFKQTKPSGINLDASFHCGSIKNRWSADEPSVDYLSKDKYFGGHIMPKCIGAISPWCDLRIEYEF